MYNKDPYHTFFYRNTTLLILSSHFTDVGWNPAHGEVYSMQLYMINFVCDLQKVCGTPVSSINKTDRHDIIQILLNVTLNTIALSSHFIRVSLYEVSSYFKLCVSFISFTHLN